MPERPRFAVDEMLGSLARWLRIMGYDAAYERDRSDSEILEAARKEDRVVLTRDRQLAERAGERGLLVESDELGEQIRQVSAAFGLRFDEELTRCTLCNALLRPASREEVEERVPPRVRERNVEFFICRGCGQVYWKGTHWDSIRRQLREVLDYNL